MQERISVRGVGFDNVTMDEALARIRGFLASDESGAAVYTPNAEIVQQCLKDADFRALINRGALVVPDGVGVIKAARILGTPLKQKVAGVELGRNLLTLAAADSTPVYFLGGKPGVADQAAARLKESLPGLNVVGTHDGYFRKTGEENEAVLAAIRESGAKILFVCIGFPAQEKWIDANRAALPEVKVLLGLGGSLDIYAGTAKRAPKIFIKLGLEWFYRLLREPKRIGRMMALPRFYFGTWAAKLRGRREQ